MAGFLRGHCLILRCAWGKDCVGVFETLVS